MFLSKINNYLLIQIFKYFFLILFIFLSVAWLLQITRLFTITNFMHINILDIIFLSFYLIPNLISVITPFILIFGLLLCFIKLNKDNELIAIFSLGLGLKPLKQCLFLFSIIVLIFFVFLNFYIAPKIYEKYKIQEFDLRNTLDFNNMAFSNFLNINKTTILDFEKINNEYHDLLISYFDDKENLVYAKKGNIYNEDNYYNFQLNDGFKISIDNLNQIEKLEFHKYTLKIENKNIKNLEIVDKNTLTIFDDLYSKNYLNISFKIIDIFLVLLVCLVFYFNNLKIINFKTYNNIYFTSICIFIIITNQILKNSDINIYNYLIIIFSVILVTIFLSVLKKKYEQN